MAIFFVTVYFFEFAASRGCDTSDKTDYISREDDIQEGEGV
jgi:hypothetical protein